MNGKACLILLLLPAGALNAQTTNDAARTSIGVSVGIQPATRLWDVPGQLIAPVTLPPKVGTTWDPDIWHLHRNAAQTLAVQFRGTRYLDNHFGVLAEFALSAIKVSDQCSIVLRGRGGEVPNADPELPTVCNAIPATVQGSSATIALQGGMIIRPLSGSVLQPYVEGLAGFVSAGSSTAAMQADIGGVALTIYRDPGWHRFRPTFTLGAGVATQFTRGLLLRVAVRDTWISQTVVIGSPDVVSTNAQIGTKFQNYFNWMVGFDIVLKQQRGKRY